MVGLGEAKRPVMGVRFVEEPLSVRNCGTEISSTNDLSGRSKPMDDFAVLYKEMLPVVYRYVTSRVGKLHGEEITSEVFHAAVRALSSGVQETISAPWLMATAKNKVIDHWRRSERRGRIAHLVEPRVEELFEESAESLAGGSWSDVMATLDRLPTKQRTLLTLRYVDDLSLSELAEQAGISEAAAESALARARRSFRAQFEEVAS